MARRKKNHDEQPKGTVPGNWYVKRLDVFPSDVLLCFGDREAMCRTAYDAFVDDGKGYGYPAERAKAYASELREHFGKSRGEIDGECLSVTDGNGSNRIWIVRMDGFEGTVDDVTTLSHECLHTALSILGTHGVNENPPFEALCYLHEAIYKAFLKTAYGRLGLLLDKPPEGLAR